MSGVIIIGAGICGLGTALLLARDGHDVTLLERDGAEVPETQQDAWDRWARRGVAQFQQAHVFLPGFRQLLEQELPDVLTEFVQAGASRLSYLELAPFDEMGEFAIDAELWTYNVRRPIGEWIFWKIARRQPRLHVRRGVRVESLIKGASVRPQTPHVVGVRTDSGEELRADLVIDASGRGSRAAAWLDTVGARPFYEEKADSGFTYFTRYYTGEQPETLAPFAVLLNTFGILTLPYDTDTWSITITATSDDAAMKSLRDPARLERVIRACPLHAHWLDGEPISDVLAMSGVVDRYRRFFDDNTPVVTGFVAVADALACTNPNAGRGMAVGMRHAASLRDTLRDAAQGPLDFVMRFDEATERTVALWYRAQIAADRWWYQAVEARRQGLASPRTEDSFRPIARFLTTARSSPELFRANLEYTTTITPVQEIIARPGMSDRISEARRQLRAEPPPATPGPDYAQLLDLVR